MFGFDSLEAVNGIQKSKPAPTVASTWTRICQMCKGDHLYYCKKFLAMTAPERQKCVSRSNMCLNCLKDDHQAKTCPNGRAESVKKYNTLLHFSTRPQAENQSANSGISE